MRRTAAIGVVVSLLLAVTLSVAQAQSRFFASSDGVRLHYLEAGHGRTIIFVPGWDMPGWIFQRQIDYFARSYHVVAFDPRSQGDSDIATSGHEPVRRSQDIADLIAQFGGPPAILVGWSLGVMDVLAYVHTHGDARIAGLVLIDNSVGEDPAPMPARFVRPVPQRRRPPSREESMAAFVRGMFHQPQPPEYLERLTETALRTPPQISAELLRYPVPRTYWKEAIYSTTKPVLYTVRPSLTGQAENLLARRENTEIQIFADAGHALFVDESTRFNHLMEGFIHQRVWP
jgi:microsomal epoxide hydrolase